MGLVLGKRADLTSLKNKEEKCVIEAYFDISKYNLQSFFEANDLDYENETIIRREILPSGKSRAFINDSPVNLQELQDLSLFLIDIHSQQQTQAVLSVKDAQELLALQASLFQPLAEKAVAYNRHLYEIATGTGAEFHGHVESKMADAQKAFHAIVDNAAKNAPAGTEAAVAAFKTAVSAGNNALETVQKAVKQATEVAEANVKSMTSTALNAGKTTAKKR
jgi:phasin family protein